MKLETVTQVGRSDLLLYDRRKGKYRKREQKTDRSRQRDRHEGSETDTQAETDRPEAKRQK